MAKMPASSPVVDIRAPEWLPGESVSILSYAGASINEQVSDALVHVDMDPATNKVLGATFQGGHAATVRRRLAVKGWTLYEEVSPGVAGKAIPFTPENVENLDPAYAQFVDAQILEHWARWRAVTGQQTNGTTDKEVAQERKPFQDGAETSA